MTRIRVNNELLVINLCSLILILIIHFVDVQVLRIILGLPFILFFPGYTLLALLFPKKSDMGTFERLALSVGLSVVITPLIGFLLHFVWEIALYPTLVSLTVFTAGMSVAAWYRRSRVPQEERYDIAINLASRGRGRGSALDKVVSLVLALAFLGAIGALGYVVANPKEGEQFSEFYILGAESRVEELALGDEAVVVLGITNHEQSAMAYRVQVLVGGLLSKEEGPIMLAHGEKWEDEIRFRPSEACASTELTQEVIPADGSSQAEVTSVQVASADHLEPGDRILVGEEAAEVKKVLGGAIGLEDGLKQYHAVGTVVTEVQKVEFRLLKIRDLGEGGDTSLSLWVGKDHLDAYVLNRGDGEAAYQVEVTIGGPQKDNRRVESEDQVVAAGDEWIHSIDYEFSENHEIDFSLYKDGELLYRRLESGAYPSLYVWIHVRE